jgi:hypothetical protein
MDLEAPGGNYGDLDAKYEWRIRRCGTRARDGMTFMVKESDDGFVTVGRAP